MKINSLPLGLLPNVNISQQEVEMLKRIDAFEFPYLEENMMAREKWDKSDLSKAIKEFKRFMALAGLGVRPLAMVGPKIDEVWHNFLIFTTQYRHFCEYAIGQFINHQPHTKLTPVPYVAFHRFIDGYKKYFGEIPSIWFSGLDQSAIDYCLQRGGNPPLQWSGWTGE